MMDYMASIIARMEHEERVRQLSPVYDDEWLKDDRQLSTWPIRAGIAVNSEEQANWAARQLGRMFYAVGSGLVATGEWLRQRQPYSLKSQSCGDNRSVLN